MGLTPFLSPNHQSWSTEWSWQHWATPKNINWRLDLPPDSCGCCSWYVDCPTPCVHCLSAVFWEPERSRSRVQDRRTA